MAAEPRDRRGSTERAAQIRGIKITRMVLFSDQVSFPPGFVSFEPENVSPQLRFLCCHPDLSLESRSDGTMSQSRNGETSSHGRWCWQARLRRPVPGPGQRGTSQLSVDIWPELQSVPSKLGSVNPPTGSRRGAQAEVPQAHLGTITSVCRQVDPGGRPLSFWKVGLEGSKQPVTRWKTWLMTELSCCLSLAGPRGDGLTRRAGEAWGSTRNHPFLGED